MIVVERLYNIRLETRRVYVYLVCYQAATLLCSLRRSSSEPRATVPARDSVAFYPDQVLLLQTPRKLLRLFLQVVEIDPVAMHQCRRWQFIDVSSE